MRLALYYEDMSQILEVEDVTIFPYQGYFCLITEKGVFVTDREVNQTELRRLTQDILKERPIGIKEVRLWKRSQEEN